MKLTQEHLNFYREQKTPTPQWAKTMAKERKYPWNKSVSKTSIDRLINYQTKENPRLEAVNLCSLLRNARNLFTAPRQDLGLPQFYDARTYLYHIAFRPCGTDSKRRIGYARKWFKRIYT